MPDHDHEEIDGCTCGLDHSEHEATPDDELPPAAGGVVGGREPRKRKATRTAVEGDA